MSTQMSHFVKKSNRKTMLLNGATSMRMAESSIVHDPHCIHEFA